MSVQKVSPVVDVKWLQNNLNSVKVIDATFTMGSKPSYDDFLVKDYGDFRKLMTQKVENEFLNSHIPGAVHFNLDVGGFPGRFARFDIYPAKIFESYMQLLGLNNNDHIVVYGRGSNAGMLFAARVWWLLKYYAHESVSVLDGGFAAWKEAGLPVSSQLYNPQRGTWRAQRTQKQRLADFDELTSAENGTPLLASARSVNFLDNRTPDEFYGRVPPQFPAKRKDPSEFLKSSGLGATGFHVSGAKNVPVASVMNEKGMKSVEEVARVLQSIGFDPISPTYFMCNRAMQASLVSLALERNGTTGKVYNDSMEELSQRASHFINEK